MRTLSFQVETEFSGSARPLRNLDAERIQLLAIVPERMPITTRLIRPTFGFRTTHIVRAERTWLH